MSANLCFHQSHHFLGHRHNPGVPLPSETTTCLAKVKGIFKRCVNCDSLLSHFIISDDEAKAKTESPSSDSASQDTNEDSCGTRVRDDQEERSDRAAEDGSCSPDSVKAPLLKSVLSVDSEDSCNPSCTSLEFPKTPSDSPASESQSRWIHLTHFELVGLRTLIEKLESLPDNKKCAPVGIENPQALLEDMKVKTKGKVVEIILFIKDSV